MSPKNAVLLVSILATALPCLYPAVVSASALSDSTLRQTSAAGGVFSDDSIQPPTPADSIPSTYNLVQELSAWADLSVLLALVARDDALVAAAVSDSPLLVFAPTDRAFLSIVQSISPDVPDDAETSEIVTALDSIWLTLTGAAPGILSIANVLAYHIVDGNLSELDIVAGSPLASLLGPSIVTEGYPLEILDLDPTVNSSRLARQIANSNGRVSFIDNVLFPFDVRQELTQAEIDLPVSLQGAVDDGDPLFSPFRSLADFVSSRNDLIVLTQLVIMNPGLVDVLMTSTPLHVFAPTDTAFINFVSALGDEEVVANILPVGGLAALGNRTELSAFASRLSTVWGGLQDVPSLSEIIAYHVVNTSSSFTELDGAGPQQTLFMSQDFEDEITVSNGTVQDADSTADSQLIASFVTRNGFVSVIDTVLLPLTLGEARQALEALLSPGGVPVPPRASPAPFSPLALQPNIPDQSVDSTYTLVQELSAWQDASVLVALLVDTPLLGSALSPDPLLVFAPTNDAFRALVRRLRPDFPENLGTRAIVDALAEIWDTLSSTDLEIPTIQDVLSYHIVAGDLPEQEIMEMGSLPTVFGRSLGTRRYPRVIFDEDRATNSRRLGRQISNTNGRVSFIDNVLLPINLTAAVEAGDITIPVARQGMDTEMIDDVFRPLRSVLSFVTSRRDLRVSTSLVLDSELLQNVLSNSPMLHVFAPNDTAFVALVEALVPEEVIPSIFPVDGPLESVLQTDAATEMFTSQLSMVWASLEGVPSLEEIVTYHVLNTTSTFDELVGAGPQQTLFSREGFASEITIVEGAVQDADGTEDTPLVASFVTGTGFVSVMEGVLVPFTLDAGRAAVMDLLEMDVTDPSPEITPEVTSEATSMPTSEVSPESTMMPTAETSPGATAASDGDDDDDDDDDDDPVCFPSTARLQLANGAPIHMRDLEAGLNVHVGDGITSPVFLFTHKQADVIRPFARITTRSGHQVTLTPSHYLYANGRLTSAKAVRVGDVLETTDGKSVVVKTELVKMSGLYAPHTMHGDMMVDGVRVSGYSTALHPRFAHAMLAPVRLFVRMTSVKEPLGRLFYQGADNIARMLPSGSRQY